LPSTVTGANKFNVIVFVLPFGEQAPTAEFITTPEAPIIEKSDPSAAIDEQIILSAKVMVIVEGAHGCTGTVPIAIGGSGARLNAVVLATGTILPQSPTSVFASEPLRIFNE
jgi:hypothetical protein